MKVLILILHMVSGSILEVIRPEDVSLMKDKFRAEIGCCSSYEGRLRGSYMRDVCCSINGTVTHIALHNIEYVEEKWVDVDLKIDTKYSSCLDQEL